MPNQTSHMLVLNKWVNAAS